MARYNRSKEAVQEELDSVNKEIEKSKAEQRPYIDLEQKKRRLEIELRNSPSNPNYQPQKKEEKPSDVAMIMSGNDEEKAKAYDEGNDKQKKAEEKAQKAYDKKASEAKNKDDVKEAQKTAIETLEAEGASVSSDRTSKGDKVVHDDREARAREHIKNGKWDEAYMDDNITFKDMYNAMKKEGYSDDQIEERLDNSEWGRRKNEGVGYAKWKQERAEEKARLESANKGNESAKKAISSDGVKAIEGTMIDSINEAVTPEEKQSKFEAFKKWLSEHVNADTMGSIIEAIATVTANATLGAKAGFEHTSFEPVVGLRQGLYRAGKQKEFERQQEVKDEKNKGQIDIANKMGYLSNSPVYEGYSEKTLNRLAQTMVGGLSRKRFEEIIAEDLNKKKLTPEQREKEISEAYQVWKNARQASEKVTEQQDKQLSLTERKANLANAMAQTAAAYKEQAAQLRKLASELTVNNYSQIAQLQQQIVNTSRNLNNLSMNESSQSQWEMHTEGKAQIYMVNASMGGSGGHSWQDSTGKTKDLEGLKALDEAVQVGNEVKNITQAEVEAAKKAMLQAADDLEKMADEFINKKDDYLNLAIGLDDGIIKGRGVAQKIIRADGEVITISPDDNIYVTKNELTTENDNGEDVIPMEQDEKAIAIMGSLGYEEGNEICKDFDYYLDKLKGCC